MVGKRYNAMKKTIKTIFTALIVLIAIVALAACSDEGPEPGFDVTGVWSEQGGGSTVEFTASGGYILNFNPGLSDGTTKFEGDSYDRIDNGHLSFIVIMGRAPMEIIDVEASISSDHVLKFKLDGKTYKFTKDGG